MCCNGGDQLYRTAEKTGTRGVNLVSLQNQHTLLLGNVTRQMSCDCSVKTILWAVPPGTHKGTPTWQYGLY